MTAVIREVERLYADWRQAMRSRDVAWAERTEHENFRYTGSDGTRKGRADHVAQITSAVDAEFRTEIVSADDYGDAIVVTGNHWVRSEVNPSRAGLSAEIVDKMRRGIEYAFTSVWVRAGGELSLVAHHTSERRTR